MYLDQTSRYDFEKYEFIISSLQSIIPESKDSIIPFWAGIRALLSNTFLPRMHVEFPKNARRLKSVIPVDLKSFWSSASNKHQIQLASRKMFRNKSFMNEIDVILSGYMTDAYGVYPGVRIVAGVVTEDSELCFSIGEVDSRIIPHIAIAYQEEIKRVVLMSNDTDVVIYSLAYNQKFCELDIQGTLAEVSNKRWTQKHTDSQAWTRTWWREVFSFVESLHSDLI